MVRIKLGPFYAKLENGIWTSDSQRIAQALQRATNMDTVPTTAVNPEHAIAKKIMDVMGSEIIEVTPQYGLRMPRPGSGIVD